MNYFYLIFCLLFCTFSFGQKIEKQIELIDTEIEKLELKKKTLFSERENLKLQWIQTKIIEVGIPIKAQKEEVIKHSAYFLSYNESHEQANWVMHIITPDIITGNNSRSNDFRPDSLIETGSSVEQDYFIKTMNADSSDYTYEGYGYDRGHLAPSADFRWSQKALSESFLYSNMSPQLDDFNRLKWAELENWLREYVEANNSNLLVVTAPILREGLPKIEKSINGVSIPEFFIKTAIDLDKKTGIGFIMPNEKISLPIESFAVKIDSIEKILGYNLYSLLADSLEKRFESTFDINLWLPKNQKGDFIAVEKIKLPKNALNTYDASKKIGDNIIHTVCGKVVSTKKHDKGHVFMNLDKKFPNQIFSVSIFESNIKNFSYVPEIYLLDKNVCITAKISDYNDLPSMIIVNEKQISVIDEF